MILVDTSIWIDFFKRKEPIFTKLRELIESSDILAHEVVFGELLQGCKNKSELNFIIEYWNSLNNSFSNGSFIQAGRLSFEQKHIDHGIGIIDSVLMNEVKSKGHKLWTLDKKILKSLESKYQYHSP